jgi:tetratricopeptide (TPR) repeat protein
MRRLANITNPLRLALSCPRVLYLAMLCVAVLCVAPLFASALPGTDEPEATLGFERLIKDGKYDEARAELETYTAAHPSSWQAFYQLGYADFRLHRIQQSVDMLCKSLVLNPKFAESHKILAYDLNILGRQDLAIHELEQALSYNPQSAESYYELGRIYYEQGSYLKAVESLEKSKSLAPDLTRAYHNLGLAYSAVGENAKAVENFEASLRVNAQQSSPSAWPLIDYATYLNTAENFEMAKDLLLRAIAIDHSWDQEYSELAKAYRGLGLSKEAVSALKQALVLNPRKAEYHYVLAQLYRQTHQTAEAAEQLAEYERLKTTGTK